MVDLETKAHEITMEYLHQNPELYNCVGLQILSCNL